MKELEYPFDSEYILKKSKKLKRELLEKGIPRLKKKIAVLGGSTTHDIVRMLELFLLDQGIEPEFYESEYGQYFQEAMFANAELSSFAPDIIFLHTSNRNITAYPQVGDSREQIEALLDSQYEHFAAVWDKLGETYHCPIIQNNFEYPFYRLLGNKDASDIHGRIRFITKINERFYNYAESHENFYINDINYMAAAYGLDKWSDPFYWHMYKYCMCMQAIPEFAFNLSNIIKAVFGKNKKALVLDLDNTLWGGVVGDDGAENLEIGQETSLGQVYSEFQSYIKAQKEIGIMLNVNSKNEEVNALAGLNHPEGILKPEDFILIKANWEPKSINIEAIASELNVLPDSLVFVDDNPAEREIVRAHVPGVAVPDIRTPEQYIHVLDRSGFFEVTGLSEDDRKRNDMYKANILREKQQAGFADYAEYLRSLKMHATIKPFEPMYMSRIAQLTNKSNQFNLTTKRYTQSEIEQTAKSPEYIDLYGKLEDKFGDNGIVSVVIGKKDAEVVHIDLWIMSCRVLKRDMEYAMMDCLVRECRKEGLSRIRGYYYPTAKNQMVSNFYELQGFHKIEEDTAGNTIWEYEIPDNYENKNKVIDV
ncbi:MAG: HAD-IIIC family phosphatase [Clostridiales bacterium]|nr:HAD-IIIC family phosphatase [Clostridiales bacterium]